MKIAPVKTKKSTKEVIVTGTVILKGKSKFYGTPETHYHIGMLAGENTLNAELSRINLRLSATKENFSEERFVKEYIEYMTSENQTLKDPWADSTHRIYFANYANGINPLVCGEFDHGGEGANNLVFTIPLIVSNIV